MCKPYQDTSYNLLMIKDLERLHEQFIKSGSCKKDQSNFQNFVHPHLLVGDSEVYVIDIINVPELHLLIGVVDKHLFGLENIFGVEWVNSFLQSVHIQRKEYQGGHSLEGNQSSALLERLPDMAEKKC